MLNFVSPSRSKRVDANGRSEENISAAFLLEKISSKSSLK